MKRKLLSLAIAVASGAFMSLSAQTDVTATYLTNAGFDTSFDYDALATGNLGTGAAGKKALAGWTITSGTNSCAGAFAYGTAATFNTATVPASGYNSSTGGCFAFSAGWGENLIYTTTNSINLPEGKYALVYAVNNRNANSIGANRFGFVPDSGTPKYGTKTVFASSAWVADTVTFTVAGVAPGKISMGYVAVAGVGSGSSAKLCVDFLKLLYYGVDKTELNAKILEAQTLLGSDTGSDADALNAIITAAQAVASNTNATQAAVSQAITNLNTGILNYKLANATESDPVDVTAYYGVNLDFEDNQADKQQTIPGWTKTGAANSEFCTRNDAGSLGEFKHGNIYFQYWASDLPDYQISQTITGLTNGRYTVLAGASNTSANNDGFYLFAGTNKTTVTSVAGDYGVEANVVDGTLTFGVKAVGTVVNAPGSAEWTQADNFRIYYMGPVTEPTLAVSKTSLTFNSANLTKTFTVSGAYLTANVTLTAPAGITLDKTSVTPAEATAVATITATFDNATNITGGSITAKSGSLTQTIAVTASADGACFVSHQPTKTNLIPDPYLGDLSVFGGWGHKSVVHGAEAYCGEAAVKFNATTNGWPDGAALDVNNVAWQPNHVYKVYAKIKAVDGTFAFFAKGADPDAAITIPQSATGDWESFEAEFTTGPAASTNFFSFNNVDNSSTGKVAYIDNWELYDMGSTSSVAAKLDKPFLVRSGKGELTIQSEDAKSVVIYSITGQLVKKVEVSGSKTIALPQGFYVVNGIKAFVK